MAHQIAPLVQGDRCSHRGGWPGGAVDLVQNRLLMSAAQGTLSTLRNCPSSFHVLIRHFGSQSSHSMFPRRSVRSASQMQAERCALHCVEVRVQAGKSSPAAASSVQTFSQIVAPSTLTPPHSLPTDLRNGQWPTHFAFLLIP